MRFSLPENSPLPTSYTVVACQLCGNVYADTRGTQGDYDHYYRDFSHYEDPSIATGGGDSQLDALRIAETISRLLPYLSGKGKNARIIDIGCARGGILKAFEQKGFANLHGLDPSPTCVTYLQSIGIQASCGVLSDPDCLGRQAPFDLIILSHVLEHLIEIGKPLQYLRSRLTPGGRIYIEVPDASRYKDHPAVPFYYFDCEHINHFSQETLAILATLHGFKLIADGESGITLPNNASYPVVWGLFEIDEQAIPAAKPAKLSEKVRAYIEQSRLVANYPSLESLARSECPVVLWGAGSYAQRLLKNSPLGQCRIVSIVDRDQNKQGQLLAGIRIASPAEGLATIAPGTVVVIAAALHSEEIRTHIRTLGFQGEVVLPASS